jgi:hypothetical protein
MIINMSIRIMTEAELVFFHRMPTVAFVGLR